MMIAYLLSPIIISLLGIAVFMETATLSLMLIFVPLISAFLDEITPNIEPNSSLSLENLGDASTLISLFGSLAYLFLIGACFFRLQHPDVDLSEFTITLFSLSFVATVLVLPCVHELLHSKSVFCRVIAATILALLCYPHFAIVHICVHHSNVGLPEDPSTPVLNEGFYEFFNRTLCGGVHHALIMQSSSKRNNSIIARLVFYFLPIIIGFGLVAFVFGTLSLILLSLNAVVGIVIIELSNYIQHYGLRRNQIAGGCQSSVGAECTWNSYHRFSNWLLLDLPQHAAHHSGPDVDTIEFQTGENCSPKLPLGYFSLFFLALFPPAWRLIMNPLIVREKCSACKWDR